jgi:hypothetical protein
MVRGYELVTVYRKGVGGAEYLAKFTASLDGAIKDGYIVPADRGRCWPRPARCSSQRHSLNHAPPSGDFVMQTADELVDYCPTQAHPFRQICSLAPPALRAQVRVVVRGLSPPTPRRHYGSPQALPLLLPPPWRSPNSGHLSRRSGDRPASAADSRRARPSTPSQEVVAWRDPLKLRIPP